MTKEDYVAKISAATPVGLVIIIYELIIEHTENAKKALLSSNSQTFESELNKARDFLLLLMKSLDFSVDISKMYYNTYKKINALLIDAYFKKEQTYLSEATELLTTMLGDWREILKTENETPVMENAEKLYAGLTYKNNELSEYSFDSKERGYTV